jgi:hypothetical protein
VRSDLRAGEPLRFPLLRSRLWRPLLLLFGGTRGRSYLEIDSETLTARFGWAFRYRFPLSDIEDATLVRRLPWYSYSIGWHSDLRGGIGLTGAYKNLVEIRFRRRRWVWMLLPLPCKRLVASLEEPQAFLDALARARERAWSW